MIRPAGAVFLSYASEDTAAAKQICEVLRGAGIEVWFDQSELRGGDAWDAAIRAQIKSCALFVPIISSHSRERIEGYFRLEWKLAVDRSHLMAAEKPFLVPVLIDDTKNSDARVPDKFRDIQWTRLPGGAATPEFVNRILRLLSPVETASNSASQPALDSASRATRVRQLSLPLIAMTVLLIGALAYIALSHRSASVPASQDALPTPPPVPAVATAAISEKSIAVLPFTDLSEKKDQQYFSDGLSEELIDLLAQIPDLRVTARTSSFSFRDRPVTVAEIGHALSVSNLLEGSVRKSGNTIRITAQLVRADNGFHLWSETYDRDLRDVFKVQDDIARVVVDKLKITLANGSPITAARTENVEAHNLLLQGNFALQSDTDDGTREALAIFQRAVVLDPNYAAAVSSVGLAKYRRGVNGYEAAPAAIKMAGEAAKRAIALDPNLADAYALLGAAKLFQFDWTGANEAGDHALKLDPTNGSASLDRALILQATRGSADAIVAIRETLDRDPRNLLARRYAARIMFFAGRLTEAEQLLRQILDVSPNFSAARYELGRVLLWRGKTTEAVAEFEAEANPAWRPLGLPLGYRAAGRTADADKAMSNLVAFQSGAEFQVGEAFAYYGNADKAFEFLNRAVTNDPGIVWLPNDPLIAGLTKDPRYAALLKRINLSASL